MAERILGLDLGTNSVGWAFVQWRDDRDRPDIQAGVYVFPEAGDLDGGLFVSNRLKRGQKRRQRIQVRRRRERLRTLMRALVQNGLLPADPVERDRIMSLDRDDSGGRPHHPFMLRRRGLDQELSLYELGRCLYHIARRRGYFSTRDLMRRSLEHRLGLMRSYHADLTEEAASEEDEGGAAKKAEAKEESALLGRLREVREKIAEGEARTIGEFCAARLDDPEVYPCGVRAGGKRDERKGRKQKTDPLGWRADRLLHEEEFDLLWAGQSRFHPTVLTRALRDRLWELTFYQRPLASKKGLVGTCEFLPARKRLPRACLLAQRCSILQTLVNMTVQPRPGETPRRLTGVEVAALAHELDRRNTLTWVQAKGVAELPLSARFSDEPLPARRGQGKAVRGRKMLAGNRTAQAMREALGADRWNAIERCQQEEMVDRLVHCRHPADVARGLRRDFGLSAEEVHRVACTTFVEGYTNHCARVWRDIEPHMLAGRNYFEACVEAGYRAPNESTVAKPEVLLDRLGRLPDLRSPVVQRSAGMAFKVINAALDRFGKPDRIRIEMPRDVSQTNKQRQEMWKRQDENAGRREAAAKLLTDNGMRADNKSIDKVRLWWEAGGRSPYEPDREVTLVQLIQEYEIDHIVPRSRCWDDSWVNLTICPRGLNLEKGNRTPFEWASRTERWDAMRSYVAGLHSMFKAKRDRFLREEWEQDEFTNRALSDTRYLSTVVKNEAAKLGIPVEVSRGQLTAELRHLWELGGCLPLTEEQAAKFDEWRGKRVKKQPKPRFDHRHHALDAVLTALTDTRTLQGMTAWYKERETGVPSKRIPKPKPWATIGEDLRDLMDRTAVVHAATRGVTGALHEETARRPPQRAAVDAALAALPPERSGRVRRCVVVGTQLVRLDDAGTPKAAYDLGSNHHAVIWEREAPDKSGGRPRDITVVSTMEAARRSLAGEPLFARERTGWRFVMAVCKNDIVEWTGETPGRWRVVAFSASGDAFDVHLLRLVDAVKDMQRVKRVRSSRHLGLIRRRVCLSPLGDVVSSEPEDAVD